MWSRAGGVLGHRRLSIIDLSENAKQPLLSEDGEIGVVVNGEIYNFAELRASLLAKGHTFRSASDSEVVVHLYEEHGEDCIAMLGGMFSLAIWDAKRGRLLLARDRAGKKPLFWRRIPEGGIAFASELNALRAGFPDLPTTPDPVAIDEYLTLQYVPSPRSIYREIEKLEAAHYLVFERDQPIRTRRYWHRRSTPELSGSEEELARELRRLLEAAVKKRLVGDVPLGAFLSGGIDSSAVVGLIASQTTQPVKTFAIGFPNATDSELPWARMVAKRWKTDHHEEVVTPDIRATLSKVLRNHGEPFADSSAIAMYRLAAMTKRHVTIALSGDGADEAFAGYTRYKTARLAHVYDALPAPLRSFYQRGSMAVAKAFVPHMVPYVDHYASGEGVRYQYVQCQFTAEEKRSLYLGDMRDAATNATTERFERLLRANPRASSLGRLLDLDSETYLVDDINVKVDIASMSHALEVRCPFLDTDVVEFASRLPARMLLRRRGKHLLRRAIGDLVPPPILSRSKRGFGLPLRRWLKEELNELVHDVLLDRTAHERGLFDSQTVRALVSRIGKSYDTANRVWTLLVLELWFREVAPRIVEDPDERPADVAGSASAS